MVSSLEIKISETEKKYEETNKISEERLKEALEAESKIIQLKTSMQRFCIKELQLVSVFDRLVVVIFLIVCRLEEKVSDMKSENQILRQQALLTPSVKKVLEYPETPATKVNICWEK